MLGAGLVGTVAVWACLPGLVPNLCGNGHIDPGEECDPGRGQNPGCNSVCRISCDAGSSNFVDFATSGHCYFTFAKPLDHDNAFDSCAGPNAGHLVTFADDTEAEHVAGTTSPLRATWPKGVRFYWVGLDDTKAVEKAPTVQSEYRADMPLEPGWSGPARCPGCYLRGVNATLPGKGTGSPTTKLTVASTGTDAGAPQYGVVEERASDEATELTGTLALAQVICEREPVGARSVPCFDGSFCFDVVAQSRKRYLYNPAAATASAAEQFCRSLSPDAGTSSLVTFKLRSEREQVIWELSQLVGLQVDGGGTPLPSAFWIGLSAEPVATDAGADAGSPLVWRWDDGSSVTATAEGSPPSVWGNLQPPQVSTGARAYIVVNYTAYDTGLAYARPDDGQKYPFVCEY